MSSLVEAKRSLNLSKNQDKSDVSIDSALRAVDWVGASRKISISSVSSVTRMRSVVESKVLRKALKKSHGIKSLFPVQAASIPLIYRSYVSPAWMDLDLAASVPTGQGKTLGYLIPILYCLLEFPEKLSVTRAVVIVPTKILQNQVFEVVSKILKELPETVNITCKILESFTRNTSSIVISTPEKYLLHSQEFPGLRWLVVDEADKVLDSTEIAKLWRGQRNFQVLLFTATMTKNPMKLEGLRNLVLIEGGQKEDDPEEGLNQSISHYYLNAGADDETKLTKLKAVIASNENCLIFMSSLTRVSMMIANLVDSGIDAKQITGNISDKERNQAIKLFNKNSNFALVTTDVCARGLDLQNLKCVINFDLPSFARTYIHRAGRTGRAGNKGTVVSLVTKKGSGFFRSAIIDKLKKKFHVNIEKFQ
jgi:superfamily II DNA/RNA helicase